MSLTLSRSPHRARPRWQAPPGRLLSAPATLAGAALLAGRAAVAAMVDSDPRAISPTTVLAPAIGGADPAVQTLAQHLGRPVDPFLPSEQVAKDQTAFGPDGLRIGKHVIVPSKYCGECGRVRRGGEQLRSG